MTLSFPISPSELTASWLTERLRTSGTISKASVVAHTLEPIGEGVGMLAVISRVGLTYDYDEPGAPQSIIAKFATPNEGNRAVAAAFKVYEREALFLRDVAHHTTVPIPAVYGVDIDLPSGEFVLLMEDLGGYRTGDQVAGCGPQDAMLVLDAAAPLHAAFWGRTDDPLVAFAPRVDGDTQLIGMSAACASGWETCMERFGSVVPAVIHEARERYTGAAQDLHRRMGARPQTLLHGDLRLDNIMFGTDPSQRAAVVIDWQGLIVSCAAQDVAYLLTQNLTIENRRAHEHELLVHYHSRLVENGVTDYSFAQFEADYHLAALYLFVYAVVIGGTLDPSNERGMAFMSQLIERACTAIVDHDLLSLI